MSQAYVWELRYNADLFESEDDVVASWGGVAKKYCFQLEQGKGENAYMHYQCRISLFHKLRNKHEVMDLLDIKPQYCEPTLTREHKKEPFYQMKKDTRVKGPWTDKDEKKAPKTKQMILFEQWGLQKWQIELEQKLNIFCLRSIDLIYDPEGNNGKSLFSEYMEYKGVAEEVPCYRLMDDIFQWVYCMPTKKVYILDMPRGMKKDKLGDLYSGIEVIKNGVAYDKRNRAKKKRFDRPRIAVFTNELPCMDLMSKDRWVIHIIKNGCLEPYQVQTTNITSDLDFSDEA